MCSLITIKSILVHKSLTAFIRLLRASQQVLSTLDLTLASSSVHRYGNIERKTDSNFLNDSYGIHVDKNNVFVCSTMDNGVRVLDLELNPHFFIPDIEKPRDIIYFKGLYFVTKDLVQLILILLTKNILLH